MTPAETVSALASTAIFSAALAAAVDSFPERAEECRHMCTTEYQEALSSYRHYSLLRFTIAGAFSAATGALFVGWYSVAKVPADLQPHISAILSGVSLLGLVFSICFFYVETVLNRYLNAFSRFIRTNSESHFAQRPQAKVSPAIWAMYLTIVLAWGFLLIASLPDAARRTATCT